MPGVDESFVDTAAWFVGADYLVHLRWTAPMVGLRAELKVQGREVHTQLEGVLISEVVVDLSPGAYHR